MSGTAGRDNEPAGTNIPSRTWWSVWGDSILLAMLVIIGLGLRIYRLEDVSPWCDDFGSVVGLKSQDLATYLSAIRFVSPDHVPGYHVVLYLWSKLMGSSLLSWRLLSIVCGTATIPALYLASRRYFGTRAGLIAATCLAISPIHIWYSQAIRYIALMEPISVLSILFFFRILQGGGKRWWLANAAANIALFWIHAMTLLLPFVELVTLFLFARNKLRHILAWGFLQFVFLVPQALWLLGSAPYTVSFDEDVYGFNWMTLLVDWIVDDAVSLSQAWMFHTSSSPLITDSPYTAAGFLVGYGLLNLAMLLVFGACLIAFTIGACREWWIFRRNPDETQAGLRARAGLFLVLLHTLPLAILLCLSLTFRTVLMPQYTLYSTFATYVAVGTCLGALRSGFLRMSSLILTLFVIGWQTNLTLHEPSRFDWLSAARLIERCAAPQELVLVRGRFFDLETFRLATGPSDRPTLPVHTLQAICDKADRYLSSTASHGSAPVRVWAVIEVQFDSPPLPLDQMEAGLHSRGLRFTESFFPGMGGIAVYGIERDPDALPSGRKVDIVPDYDYERLLKELGVFDGADVEANAAMIRRLRGVIETDWVRGAYSLSHFSLALSDEGCADLAEAAARKAIELRPDSGFGYFGLALALGEQGDVSNASAAFSRALALDRVGFFRLYEPLFRATYVANDTGVMAAEIARLDAMGTFLPQLFRARADFREASELRYCNL